MTTVRWLGAAGLELTTGNRVLLLDPYLSRPSKWQSLARPLEPDRERIREYLRSLDGEVSGLLVGHTHSDHVLDVPELAGQTGTTAYGTRSLANLLSAYGLEDRAVVAEPGAEYRIGPFVARAFRSRHGKVVFGKIPFPGEIERGLRPPLRVHRYRHGGPLAWHVAVDGTRYLHLGSADFLAEELEDMDVDVLFVCAAGRQFTPDFTRKLLHLVRPQVVVPIHFDDFSAPLSANTEPKRLPGVKLDQFVREINECDPSAKVIVPEPFSALDL